jgi:chitinase
LKKMRTKLSILLVALTLLAQSAAFGGPPTYTIDYTIEGEGSVTLDPPKDAYQKNNIVTVSATAGEGWQFDHWAGDLTGDQNPATIRVGRNHSFVAVFSDGGGGDGSGGDGGDGSGGGTDPEPRPAVPSDGLIVGYFVQWGIYRRDYVPADIVDSGTAVRVDVINYAFAGISDSLECVSIDEFADFEKRFDASETVDGVADTVAQPLKGNFNQLRKLKQIHPNIRVLLSIGGWTESARFSDVALSAASRARFVASCIDRFIYGNIAPGVDASGVFDGLDIDWEYPGRCGATCDFREEDSENFTALLAEFRSQLDAAETKIGEETGLAPELLLTIAAPAGAYNIDPIQIADIHEHLDWINLMAYDFHGGWESSGPTNHHAHLHQSPCDSDTADWGAKAIDRYLAEGVPGSKLLLGVPFYGRGWRGVSAVDDGLCQDAGGVPRGKYEKGINDYSVLAAAGNPSFYEAAAAAHWTFDGQTFWTFDNPLTLAWKTSYIRENCLRGAMFWEMSGDSTNGDLIHALREGFDSALPASNCLEE